MNTQATTRAEPFSVAIGEQVPINIEVLDAGLRARTDWQLRLRFDRVGEIAVIPTADGATASAENGTEITVTLPASVTRQIPEGKSSEWMLCVGEGEALDAILFGEIVGQHPYTLKQPDPEEPVSPALQVRARPIPPEEDSTVLFKVGMGNQSQVIVADDQSSFVVPGVPSFMTRSEIAAQIAGQNQTIVAAMPISGHRAVLTTGEYAQPTQDGTALYAGVTSRAYNVGADIAPIKTGTLENAGWTLTPNAPVYIGVNGTLTQTPPANFVRRIGWTETASRIVLDPYPTVMTA